ncbi:MAG: restriction endonuclease [Dehalococcoidia bacterium]
MTGPEEKDCSDDWERMRQAAFELDYRTADSEDLSDGLPSLVDVRKRTIELDLDAIMFGDPSTRSCGTAFIRAPDLSDYDIFRFSYCWLTTMLKTQDIQLVWDDTASIQSDAALVKSLADSETLIQPEVVRYLSRRPDHLPETNPRKFEALVASLLRSLGYDVVLTPASWDDGKDVIVIQRGSELPIVTFVECKRHRSEPVRLSQLKEFMFTVIDQNADYGVMVTTSKFSRSARQLAARYQPRMALVDPLELTAWISDVAAWSIGPFRGHHVDRALCDDYGRSKEFYLRVLPR